MRRDHTRRAEPDEKVPMRRRNPDEEAKVPNEESTDKEFPTRREVCCTLDPRRLILNNSSVIYIAVDC